MTKYLKKATPLPSAFREALKADKSLSLDDKLSIEYCGRVIWDIIHLKRKLKK